MNKGERILKNTASTVATLLMVVGVAGSAFAGSKPSLQSVSGPRFSTASFCGRYVSSYTAIYQTTAGTPTTLTTPLSALEAAVITADGKGYIVDGELTQNAPANAPQVCNITGDQTYSVGASPLGEYGYLSFNPTFTCTGYDSCPAGVCSPLSAPYGSGNIQFACYLSDPAGNQVVCSELGNTFTNNSFSARVIT